MCLLRLFVANFFLPPRRSFMKTRIIVACLVVSSILMHAQQRPSTDITIGSTDLGGVVSSPNGVEAGVWVVVETTQLPTKFAKAVVTDDRGRYLVPGLPKATYDIWVRGYGLVDSPRMKATPGQRVNLTAVLAATASG